MTWKEYIQGLLQRTTNNYKKEVKFSKTIFGSVPLIFNNQMVCVKYQCVLLHSDTPRLHATDGHKLVAKHLVELKRLGETSLECICTEAY